MASSYPGGLDALPTNKTAGGSRAGHAALENDQSDAINKIEAELGTNPSGGFATVTARLDAAVAVRTLTSGTTALVATDRFVKCNSSSGAVTVQLPAAATVSGFPYVIKWVAGGNAVTVDPNGTETIDGQTTLTLGQLLDAYTIVSDGSNWWIV